MILGIAKKAQAYLDLRRHYAIFESCRISHLYALYPKSL